MSRVVYTLPIEDFEWSPEYETLRLGYSILAPPDDFMIIGNHMTITFEYYTTFNKCRLYTMKNPELIPKRLQAIRVLMPI